MSFNIAIDGPAGAGKSTIAKKVAEKLNFIYVDTGAMYRTIALSLLRNKVDCKNETELSHALDQVEVTIAYEDGNQQVFLNGENVSNQIRTEEVGTMASVSSACPAVRAKLLNLQRTMAEKFDVLMDGRDIGTQILPEAQLKVYLTASTAARAGRRYQELKDKGQECSLEEIEKDMKERDYRDMHRETAPLKQAGDAVLVDSSDMTIDQVVEKIIGLVQLRREA
ncbi:MAG: (d)CMP kinase [Lachnospiraceae bacterium]|nr:(d)CMP kinase [Lachnospiraceae bacterium]